MSFRSTSSTRNIFGETMPSKESTSPSKSSPSVAPPTAAPVMAAPVRATHLPPTPAPKKEPTPVEPQATVAKSSPSVAPPTAAPVMAAPARATHLPPTPAPKKEPTPIVPQATVAKDEEAHFDIAQNAYGAAKELWSWGKSVPVISNLLGITEALSAKVLGTTVHMDLPALDSQVVTPQLKKIDDGIVNPIILAAWKLIEPAVVKSDEMVIQPLLKEVVPCVLAPFGMFDEKKVDRETKKAEESKAMIDSSPNPEIVPALN